VTRPTKKPVGRHTVPAPMLRPRSPVLELVPPFRYVQHLIFIRLGGRRERHADQTQEKSDERKSVVFLVAGAVVVLGLLFPLLDMKPMWFASNGSPRGCGSFLGR
jgi:hypothetical protein